MACPGQADSATYVVHLGWPLNLVFSTDCLLVGAAVFETLTSSTSGDPTRVTAAELSPFEGVATAASLASSVLVVGALMRLAGLTLTLFTPGTLAFVFGLGLLAAIRWALCNAPSNAARISRDMAEYVGVSAAISLIGAVASYPVAAFSHGFADRTLQHWDEVLHFDWLAWYRITATHPVLGLVSRAAYTMIYLSPAVLLGHYAVTGDRRRAYRFMAAVWVSAVLTLAAFRFMPAVGPFAYLWHGPIPYLPVSDLWQPEVIPELRAHTFRQIDLSHLVGLVSAPSFHAAAATLLIAFAWRERTIRAPLIGANLAMLLSTPVEGTHYLVDLILGAVVALIALLLVVAAEHRARGSLTNIPPRTGLTPRAAVAAEASPITCVGREGRTQKPSRRERG